MTVETTIQWMFDNYPDLCARRRDCYNHLFCVIGNGYEWKRGQIVRCNNYDDLEAGIIENEERDYALKEHPTAKQTEENIKKYDDWVRQVRLHHPEYKFKWYPICEYSLITQVPEDVRPDWKKAVEECKKMLMEDGICVGSTE